MNIIEYKQMRGQFRVKVYRRGKLVEAYEDNNLIVNAAKDAMAAFIAGAGAGKNITGIAVGTNGATPTPDDTEITEAYAKTIDSITFPATGQVEFSWTLTTAEANGKAIKEFGLLMQDGTLFARKHRASPINKESDIALEGQWSIIF
jgi:hypothetical protein